MVCDSGCVEATRGGACCAKVVPGSCFTTIGSGSARSPIGIDGSCSCLIAGAKVGTSLEEASVVSGPALIPGEERLWVGRCSISKGDVSVLTMGWPQYVFAGGWVVYPGYIP